MGRLIEDPDGVEGSPGSEEGLGLLSHSTVMTGTKRTERVTVVLPGGGESLSGYEIHMGVSSGAEGEEPLFRFPDTGGGEGLSRENGRLWGTYIHGLFDDIPFRRKWLLSLGWQPSTPGRTLSEAREKELDRLADILEKNSDMDALDRIIGL